MFIEPNLDSAERSGNREPLMMDANGALNRVCTGVGEFGCLHFLPAAQLSPYCETCLPKAENAVNHYHFSLRREGSGIQHLRKQYAKSAYPVLRQTVAADPDTSVGLLRELLSDPDPSVRMTVIANRSLPGQELRHLAEDASVSVRLSATDRKDLPQETLRRLAGDEADEVRSAVLSVPWPLGPSVLMQLAESDDFRLLKQLCHKPETYQSGKASVELLNRLAASSHDSVRLALAENGLAPSWLLSRLSEDESQEVRLAVAANASTPGCALAALADSRINKIRQAVAANPAAPDSVLLRMAQNGGERTHKTILQSANRPLSVLELIADKSRHGSIRRLIANQAAASPDLLRKLSKHARSNLRMAIARHPNTPADVLDRLFDDPYAGHIAVLHQNMPVERLNWVASHGSPEYALPASVNSSTTAAALSRIMQRFGDDELFRTSLAKNPRLKADLLDELARDDEMTVRRSVAENPSIETEVLVFLMADQDERVRSSASAAFSERNATADR